MREDLIRLFKSYTFHPPVRKYYLSMMGSSTAPSDGKARHAPLLSLPVELVGSVLRRVDSVATLSTSVHSTRIFSTALQQNSHIVDEILRSTIHPRLLPLAMAVQKSGPLGVTATEQPDQARALLQTLQHRPSEFLSHLNVLSLSEALWVERIHQTIRLLAERMTQAAIQIVEDSPPATSIKIVQPPSDDETLRFMVALYRTELYFRLFSADVSLVEEDAVKEQQKTMFFGRFSPWANERLASVHDFLEQMIMKGQSASHLDRIGDD